MHIYFQFSIALVFLLATLPLLGHGFVDEEIADVTKRLEAKPGDADLLLRRATLHRAHEDYPASKADLLAIGKDSPRYLEALLKLARLELENKQFAGADAVVVRYFEHGGDAPEAYRVKARLDLLLDRSDSAVRAWQRYLELAKTPTADEFLEAAEVILTCKQDATAHSVALRGVQQYPSSIPLHQFVASLDIQMGQESKAEQRFAALRERYPALTPRLLYEEGKLWHNQQHLEKAQASFRSALQQLDQLPVAKRNQPGLKNLRRELLKFLQP